MRDAQGYEILHSGVPRTFVTDTRRQ